MYKLNFIALMVVLLAGGVLIPEPGHAASAPAEVEGRGKVHDQMPAENQVDTYAEEHKKMRLEMRRLELYAKVCTQEFIARYGDIHCQNRKQRNRELRRFIPPQKNWGGGPWVVGQP